MGSSTDDYLAKKFGKANFINKGPSKAQKKSTFKGDPGSWSKPKRTPKPPAPRDPNEFAQQRRLPAPVPEPDPIDETPSLSFEEFLAKAFGIVGSAGRVDYSGVRSDLNSRAAEGDRNIAGMYRALQQKYTENGPAIQKTYADAGQSMQNTANQATSNVNASYDANRASSAEQLSALGIGEAQGNLGALGNQAGRDQQLATQNIAQNAAANQGLNAQNAQAASTFNSELGQVSGLEGNTQRSLLARMLSEKLAGVGVLEQQANASADQNRQSSAMQLAQYLSSQQDRQQSNAGAADQQAFDNSATAEELAIKRLLAEQKTATMQQYDPQGVIDQVNQLAQDKNLNPDQFISMMDAIRKLQSGQFS